MFLHTIIYLLRDAGILAIFQTCNYKKMMTLELAMEPIYIHYSKYAKRS